MVTTARAASLIHARASRARGAPRGRGTSLLLPAEEEEEEEEEEEGS